MIIAGIPLTEVERTFAPAFSLPTLRRHKSRCVLRAIAPMEPIVHSEPPKDLLGYGLMKLLANIERLDALAATTANVRAIEVMSSLILRLLEYHKAADLAAGNSPSELTVHVRCVGVDSEGATVALPMPTSDPLLDE